MITELFLNSCFSLVFCSDERIRRDKTLFRDILEIVNFYKEKESLDIPVIVKNKVDCLCKICEMKLEDKEDKNVIDSLCCSEKYKPLSDFLNMKLEKNEDERVLTDDVKQVRIRKRLISLFSNYDKISSLVDSVKNGSFDSMDDVVVDYETTIKELYANMMENNRCISIEASASLDLLKDDYASVLELIQKKYERKNTTPSGLPIFDYEVFSSGGFESSRLYVFGGSTGSGKSTIMDNFLANASTDVSLNKDKSKQKTYVYITLENSIDESLLRIYQALTNKNANQALTDSIVKRTAEAHLKKLLQKNNSSIVMKYFPAMSISPVDVMMVLDDVISEYGKESIKGLYLDYLDLLTSDIKSDLYRMELAAITLSLKTIAIHYNIPVITATQLNRGAYRVQNSSSLNLDQISESIKKVEHADFICLLHSDDQDPTVVHGKIGKNRSGKANISLDFKVDFGCFKFLSGSVVSNDKKPNDTNSSGTGFEGFGNTI